MMLKCVGQAVDLDIGPITQMAHFFPLNPLKRGLLVAAVKPSLMLLGENSPVLHRS
jgi:hypothetical protein